MFNKPFSKTSAATFSLLVVIYGITLQSLHASELVVLFFACTCNHSLHSEDTNLEKEDSSRIPQKIRIISNQLPDCHNNPNVAHICSCKNGQIVQKISDFLLQFYFIQFQTVELSIYQVQAISEPNVFHWMDSLFLNQLFKPPKIV
jgi:DNA-directed RNA polymerase subunit H (RpoH/RPB5)